MSSNLIELPTRMFGLALVSILTLTMAGCEKTDNRGEGHTYTYKYKITVTIRDQGHLLQASDVVRVREQSYNGIALVPKLCGEATALKLINGRYLFALLNGPTLDLQPGRQQWRGAPTGVLLQRLGLQTEWSWKDDSGLRQLLNVKTPVQFDPDEMPEFVSFRDMNDPTTVERIEPTQIPEWLGDDIKVEGVTVQITNEQATRGHLAHILPWLIPSQDFLDGSRWGKPVHGIQSRQFARCQ